MNARLERSQAGGDPPNASSDATWLTTREKGTMLGVLAAYAIVSVLGRSVSKAFVAVLSLWYCVFSPALRRSSAAWLTVQQGRQARFGEVYRHFRTYAQCTTDRVFLLKGKFSLFRITRTGDEHLRAAVADGTGAIMVSAHLGSFDALRADGKLIDIPINIVGYFENARMINGLFSRLSPEAATRVIHVGRGDVDFIYAVKEALDRGELVGIMGDRVGLSERSTEVEFFGRKARFATGPFALGAILGCPVFVTFGLYVEPNQYQLFCEPLMPAGKLPRKGRDAAISAYTQEFARRLEGYAARYPYNWFNFFDFWDSDDVQSGNSAPQ